MVFENNNCQQYGQFKSTPTPPDITFRPVSIDRSNKSYGLSVAIQSGIVFSNIEELIKAATAINAYLQ